MESVAVETTGRGQTHLELHGTVMLRRADGRVEEQVDGHLSLAGLAEEAALASDLLDQVRSRLGLLLTAATGSESLKADQVRVCVEAVLDELEEGAATIPCFIHTAGEAFTHAVCVPQVSTQKPARHAQPAHTRARHAANGVAGQL